MEKVDNISRLLVAKICHDIAGGVSGVSTVSDMLDSMDSPLSSELQDLLKSSSIALLYHVRLFRELYGLEDNENITKDINQINEILSLLSLYNNISLKYNYQDTKIKLLHYKLALAISDCAKQILLLGGNVTLNFTMHNGSSNLSSVIFKGEPLIKKQFKTQINNITLENINEYYIITLLDQLGKIIITEERTGEIIYRIEAA